MSKKWGLTMNLKNIFKKDPIKYKQPQEYYCSNYDCLNEIAKLTNLSVLLDKYGVKYSDSYCLDCITKGLTK